MNKSLLIVAIMLVAFVSSTKPSCALLGLADAKIFVTVVDESGAPIPEAQLKIRFSSNDKPIRTQTDGNGALNVKDHSNDGVILGEVTKEGYYMSGFAHSFIRKKFGLWQPWGKEINVIMRPIINPVPMYVRDKWFVLPAIGKEVGFDLEKSDWVAPYGLGSRADFVFNVEKHYENIRKFDANMRMTFSNPHDGILLVEDDGGGIFNSGSVFRLPRTAPLEGYQPEITQRMSRGSTGRRLGGNQSNNYIFRVRSEVDGEGNLVRAMYGKVRGEIFFEPRDSDTAEVKMNYYLNPDYTTNLEFDPKRNLSTVSKFERVEYP